MVRSRHLITALAVLWGLPATAMAGCRLCPAPSGVAAADAAPAGRPLQIEIIQALNFDRLALSSSAGGGSASVSPAGDRAISGQLVDLGGMPMSGRVRLTGTPGNGVRVEMPASVTLIAPNGANVELRNLRTSLPPAPRLGPDGTLEFSFGGQLMVPSAADGDYRGRIAIDAFYE